MFAKVRLKSTDQELKAKRAATAGYSLLEVTMAIFVSTIGLVSLLALFSQSVVTMFLVQEDLIAKQKARETLESIYTARSTITFNDIKNAAAGGVFEDGWQDLKVAGDDGLIGTTDDGAIETLNLPGPDGQLGNGDDINRTLTNFERQIQIADVGSYTDLRKITVTVRYTTSQGWVRSFETSSYFSKYR